MSFGSPVFQSAWSSCGVFGYLQRKWPAGGSTAAASSARIVGCTSSFAGVQSSGRYPSCARSCCRRRNDAGATARRRFVVVCAWTAIVFATTTRDGKRTVSPELNGAPRPDGVNRSVWSSTLVHLPAVAGTIVGLWPLSARETGVENVSLIGESGAVRMPGPGEASTTGRCDLGNQVTRTGAPTLSQARAAAATATEPAAVLVGSVTVLPAMPAPAIETWRIRVSNRTFARVPRAAVTQRFTTLATGVFTVSVSRRCSPGAQPSQPGRRTTTVIRIRSPDATATRGVSSPWETTSGTAD